jgi:hypothetical protein
MVAEEVGLSADPVPYGTHHIFQNPDLYLL